MWYPRGIRGLLDRHKVVQRNHLPGIRAQIILPDIFWLRPEFAVRLHIDAVRAVIEIEIVYIDRHHVDLQSVSNLAEGHLQALYFYAADWTDPSRSSKGRRFA